MNEKESDGLGEKGMMVSCWKILLRGNFQAWGGKKEGYGYTDTPLVTVTSTPFNRKCISLGACHYIFPIRARGAQAIQYLHQHLSLCQRDTYDFRSTEAGPSRMISKAQHRH